MDADSLPRTLAGVLQGHAAVQHAAPAVQFGGHAISYGEFQHECERAAAILWHAWGVRPGDRVAWLGLNHPGQLVLLFALARIGAVLLPLNFRLAPAELDLLVADCAPGHVVHDAAMAQEARDLAARHTAVAAHGHDELKDGAAWPPAPGAGAASSPVLLVYTSGTTSRPKAALHTQANLLANMHIAAKVQEMTARDRVLTVLPLFHVGGLCIQTLPALYTGACVLLHPRFSADATLAAIRDDRPTLTLQVPATMKAITEHAQWSLSDWSCVRAVWAGSSVLPEALVRAFHARGIPVCNVYGATETGPFSIALPPDQAFSHVGSCGWPAPGVEVRLGQVNAGVGELQIRAPNVAQAYWPRQPACDAQGWFATGDLARQDADGSYTVVGRAKDLIISGGENIHPAEIEDQLATHPAVAECAAFGMADAQWGEAVAVAVVFKAGVLADDGELRDYLAQRLARYKLPRLWLRLDALPRTALGKVQRQVLAGLALPASQTSSSTGTPRQAVAVKKLA